MMMYSSGASVYNKPVLHGRSGEKLGVLSKAVAMETLLPWLTLFYVFPIVSQRALPALSRFDEFEEFRSRAAGSYTEEELES